MALKDIYVGDGKQFGGGTKANEANDGDGYSGSATGNVPQANQSMSPGKATMAKPAAGKTKGKK